jgi:Ca2+-binding EF-hand superfamily protein
MKTEEDDGQGDTTGNADEEDVQRSELTNRIFGRLRERGIHGIRTLRVMLHNMDTGNEGTMLGRTFEGALTHMGIRLKTSEYEMFVRLFGLPDKDDREGTQLVDYVRFLGHGVGNWSTERYEVVQEAYEFLCDCCKGSLLTVDVIEKKFNVLALTSALCPGLDQHSSREEFLKQWSDSVLSADGIVTWVDFLDYYLDVSWCFDSHHGFCLYACKSWNIDMDDWIAKKVFRRYATADNEDILQWDEFQIMLQELDPTITADEAKAFFKAIDEDESGEVDLEEFLSSKVLKVKRLFDHYDVDQSRTVDQAEMICILRSLNDSISEREALSLYQYADLDGNGDISFVEFLENNLLKLLAIFEQFDKNRGGD